MGRVQGVPSGYDFGPAAIVGGVPTRDRKLTNHTFAGPDYSVIHPGAFPVQRRGRRSSRPSRNGSSSTTRPAGAPTSSRSRLRRTTSSRRPGSRATIATTRRPSSRFSSSAWQRCASCVCRSCATASTSATSMSSRAMPSGLQFSVDVINATTRPRSPDRIRCRAADSSSRSPSRTVTATRSMSRATAIPTATCAIRTQSTCTTASWSSTRISSICSRSSWCARFAAASVSRFCRPTFRQDVLPFVRPETRATTLVGHPLGARKHKQTIEPLGRRTATYRVPAAKLRSGERYTITIRFIAQMVPVNLIDTDQGRRVRLRHEPGRDCSSVVDGGVPVLDAKSRSEAAVRLANRMWGMRAGWLVYLRDRAGSGERACSRRLPTADPLSYEPRRSCRSLQRPRRPLAPMQITVTTMPSAVARPRHTAKAAHREEPQQEPAQQTSRYRC